MVTMEKGLGPTTMGGVAVLVQSRVATAALQHLAIDREDSVPKLEQDRSGFLAMRSLKLQKQREQRKGGAIASGRGIFGRKAAPNENERSDSFPSKRIGKT